MFKFFKNILQVNHIFEVKFNGYLYRFNNSDIFGIQRRIRSNLKESVVVFEVVYHAMCGNAKSICQSTKGLAEEIAAELGVGAEDITAGTGLNKDALVFLGCSCYGDKPGGRLSGFIEGGDFKGRRVVLFGTSLSSKSDKTKRMEELLKPTGVIIEGSFFCERKALPFLHKGRPSKEELAGAREFANAMKKS